MYAVTVTSIARTVTCVSARAIKEYQNKRIKGEKQKMNKMLESVDTLHTHTTYFTKEIKKAKKIAFIKDIYVTDQLLI